MDHSKCPSLLEASKALLTKSGLSRWSGQTFAFAPTYQGNDDSAFENYCNAEFHPKFGRYTAWVLFSIGEENLAKAACVCNEVAVPGEEITMKYPKVHKLYSCY